MPIKWRPFRELEKQFNLPDLREEEWVPFVPTFRAEEPSIDIYQDKNNLYVEFPLGPVKPEDVEIKVEDNVLDIKGKSEEEKEIRERDYLHREISRGSFHRTIKLPVEVKEDKAVAESKNGMLKVILPKATRSATKGKKVPVKIIK